MIVGDIDQEGLDGGSRKGSSLFNGRGMRRAFGRLRDDVRAKKKGQNVSKECRCIIFYQV